MNNVYLSKIFDKEIEFDVYMIVATNSVIKNNYVKLIHTKLFANESNINIKLDECGESELSCGIYTKEGLKLFEDESETLFNGF